MRIGDFTIWPLVDGEISSDPSLLYRNRDDRAWAPYDHFLDRAPATTSAPSEAS